MSASMTDWQSELGTSPGTRADARALLRGSDDYYVYLLWRMDKPLPEPFYVGKGHRGRWAQHTAPSDPTHLRNRHKAHVIAKHKRAGLELGYSVWGLYTTEQEALDVEVALIARIGRRQLSAGPLVNRTDGGDGTRGHIAPRGGESPSAKPVYADGVRYPCLKDAAAALGVTSSAVHIRIKHGRPGYHFEGELPAPMIPNLLGRYRRAVHIEGREYPSLSEAARARDMRVQDVAKRIMYGRPGYWYLDEGQRPRRSIWGSRDDKVPVVIRGQRYETVAQASREIGESPKQIQTRCTSPHYPDYARVDGKMRDVQAGPVLPLPVAVVDQVYDTLSAAAVAYGLTHGGVVHRCASAAFPEWRFLSKEEQRAREFTPAHSPTPIPVFVDGREYSSQSAAATGEGLDLNTVKKRVRSPAFPGWSSPGVPKETPKDGRPSLIGVCIRGVVYRSINQASQQLGEPRHAIRARVDDPAYPDYTTA